MSDDDLKLFENFETQLRYLMALQTQLKKENAALKEQLTEREDLLKKQHAENQKLQQDYTDLKNAMAISLNGGDVRETKIRLSKLVREVDRCIELLKV